MKYYAKNMTLEIAGCEHELSINSVFIGCKHDFRSTFLVPFCIVHELMLEKLSANFYKHC